MTTAPLVSICLVVYDGGNWLHGVLQSVMEQDYREIELLVLDNASRDESLELTRQIVGAADRVTVIESPTNVGFAAGHNQLIERATGDFVVLLNQDVELDRGFVRNAVHAFAHDEGIAAVQGRVLWLAAPGRRTSVLDTAGLAMHRDRRVVARGQGMPDGSRFRVPGPLWGVDGPCPMYLRVALLEAREPRTGGGSEVLDEDFFMYKEDVDLAWRLRLLGWSARYEPAAVAWHGRRAQGLSDLTPSGVLQWERSVPTWIKATSWRNHRLMQAKNESGTDYLCQFPWIAARDLLSLVAAAALEPRRLGMIRELARALPAARRKRDFVQRRAKARPRRRHVARPEVDTVEASGALLPLKS